MSRLKVVGLLCAAAALLAVVVGQSATATHEPADKVAAAASDIRPLAAEEETVLTEVVRVDTQADLILQLTSECSILTSLLTEGNSTPGATDSDGAFGQVKLSVTIDGTPVPVSTDDGQDPQETPDAENTGEIVFCNRAYARRVADAENLADGIDEEDDFIRTRTANAFNWLALNVGGDVYDKPTYTTDGGTEVTGNNVVAIEVKAEYDRQGPCDETNDADLTPLSETCSDAYIGSRSLIVEPTHTSNHELPEPAPNTGS